MKFSSFSFGVFSVAVFALVVAFFNSTHIADAANTYSLDLESSSNQYAYISDGGQANLDLSSGSFTVEAWVKLEQLPSSAGEYMYILSKDDGSSRQYNFFIADDNKVYIEFFSNNSTGTQFRTIDPIGAGDVGTWVHWAIAVSPSTPSGTIYRNGVATSSQSNGTDATSVQNGTSEFRIGAKSNNIRYFDGLIDDVRVWNSLRSEQQINDNKSVELNGNETGLAGYWKLNNNFTDYSLNQNNLSSSGSPSFSVSTPFVGFTELLEVRKSSNQPLSSSDMMQNDSELVLGLAANKTYIIEGVIFASSTSATPDIKIAFIGQTGAKIRVGYTNDVNEMVLDSGTESSRINLPANTPTSIHIKGTVVTSSTSGPFQLRWAQATSNSAPTTVMEGSYLRAEEI